KEYYDGLRRMQEWNAGVTRPDGQVPAINDADSVSQLSRMKEQFLSLGADKIPELQPLLEVEPAKESAFFPYSGFVCMRTGDQPQDLYLMMDAGPFGAGHQHEDKLNLEVYGYGRVFIADPGRYSYTAAGGPFRASGAHSLILVDGMGQNRRAADRSMWIVTDPAPGNRWVTSEHFDYAEGAYDDGFGPKSDKAVTHIRKVFFVKPEYWIVCDVLKGAGEHKLEQLWHFTPGKVESAKGMVRTLAPDAANLAVIRSDGADVRIVEGEDTPILGYYSPNYNKRSPSPTAVFTRTCTAPTAFETVLYPSPAGKTITPTVESVTCLVDGKRPASGRVSAISIKLPDCEDVFVMCHDPADFGKVKRFLDFEFTGEAVWIRTNAEGKVIKTLTLGDGKLTDN
ncbi:MAG: heparinase II/III-family protein, partial [Armatimonadetes bacterium]|nr:heparinase II/III-family protein [Armatimonadota bacterium]